MEDVLQKGSVWGDRADLFLKIEEAWPGLMSVALYLLGLALAILALWYADRCGWIARYRSCWRPFPPEMAGKLKRSFRDHLPIVGWLFQRRFYRTIQENRWEVPGFEHRFFWIRPLVIELGFGFLAIAVVKAVLGNSLSVYSAYAFWNGYDEAGLLARAILFVFFLAFLLVAALVDWDDYVIPDSVTIPGTCLGIVALVLWGGFAQNLIDVFLIRGERNDLFQGIAQAKSFSTFLQRNGFWVIWGTLEAFWAFWCFALLDRRWYPQLPWKKRWALFARTLKRSSLTWVMGGLFILGSLLFLTLALNVQQPGGDARLTMLLFAFSGLATGMISIWSIRLMGRWILRREAMGFGDVTLMGMIGVFLGWQNVLIVFFLAPFFGLIFGVLRLLFRTQREIPYGPFLCMAAVCVLFFYDRIDEEIGFIFQEVPFLMTLLGVCVVLFFLLLFLLQWVKKFIFGIR